MNMNPNVHYGRIFKKEPKREGAVKSEFSDFEFMDNDPLGQEFRYSF